MTNMRYFRLLTISVLMLSACSACSELQSYNSTGIAPIVSSGQGVDYWLEELHYTRAMYPEQLQQTLKFREQQFHNNPNNGNRLRLALLLAAGGETVRDQERAWNLLEEVDQSMENARIKELVTILLQFLDEQIESRNEINSLKIQIKENNERIEELEEQQRALTTIEQNIQQREKPVGVEHDN